MLGSCSTITSYLYKEKCFSACYLPSHIPQKCLLTFLLSAMFITDRIDKRVWQTSESCCQGSVISIKAWNGVDELDRATEAMAMKMRDGYWLVEEAFLSFWV